MIQARQFSSPLNSPQFGWSRKKPPRNRGIVIVDATNEVQWQPRQPGQSSLLPHEPYPSADLISKIAPMIIREKAGLFAPQSHGFAYIVTPFEKEPQLDHLNYKTAQHFAIRILEGVYQKFNAYFNPEKAPVSLTSEVIPDRGHGTMKSPHYDGAPGPFLFSLTYGYHCPLAEENIQPIVCDPVSYLKNNGLSYQDAFQLMSVPGKGGKTQISMKPEHIEAVLQKYTLRFSPKDSQGKITILLVNNMSENFGVFHGATHLNQKSDELPKLVNRTLYRDNLIIESPKRGLEIQRRYETYQPSKPSFPGWESIKHYLKK